MWRRPGKLPSTPEYQWCRAQNPQVSVINPGPAHAATLLRPFAAVSFLSYLRKPVLLSGLELGLGAGLCSLVQLQADADAALSAWTLDGQMPPPEQVKSTEGPSFSNSRVIGSVWNFFLAELEKWH